MIHFWSFLAGVIATILAELTAAFLFFLWDTRTWPVEKRKRPFGDRR